MAKPSTTEQPPMTIGGWVTIIVAFVIVYLSCRVIFGSGFGGVGDYLNNQQQKREEAAKLSQQIKDANNSFQTEARKLPVNP